MALDLKDLYTTLELPSVIKDLERIRNIEPGYIADMLNYVIYDFKQIWNGTETKEDILEIIRYHSALSVDIKKSGETEQKRRAYDCMLPIYTIYLAINTIDGKGATNE